MRIPLFIFLLIALAVVYFIGVFFTIEFNPLYWPWYGKIYLLIGVFGCIRAYLED